MVRTTYVGKWTMVEVGRNLNQEKVEKTTTHQYHRHNSRQRRRVTQNEIYQDAIKILDKLLTQNLEERQRSASKSIRQNQAKTRILDKFGHGAVGGYAGDEEAFGKRAQTVPESVYKPNRRRSEDRQIVLNSAVDRVEEDDVVSSADTEASEHEDDSPRKKKSFFKRAKERLRQTFRRDQKGKDGEFDSEGKTEKQTRRRKPRAKSSEEDKKKEDSRHKSPLVSPSSRKAQGSTDALKNGVNSSLASTTESNTSTSHRKDSQGKSFFKNVRRSFSKSKKDPMSTSRSDEPVSQTKASTLPGRSASICDSPQARPKARPRARPRAPPPCSAPAAPPSPCPAPAAPPSPCPAPAAPPPPRAPSLNGATASSAAVGRNRLSYYDNIPYIDDVNDDRTDSGGKSNSVSPDQPSTPQDAAGKAGGPPPPPPLRSPRKSAQMDIYASTDEVIRGADGSIIQSHVETRRQLSLEEDGDDVPFERKTEREKEELYQSIAEKLKEMADLLPMSASEGEGHRQGGQGEGFNPKEGSEELSELEKQLMMVMREGGDKLTTTHDDPTQAIVQEAQDEVYNKFSSTLRQAIGDEVGWHQLALVFHVTKGAVTAAGSTSKAVARGKEMAMRYFADRFAGWIVSQGGWESMLSESDSELD